ncbi:hypothetical protein [Clostridium sp. VAP23]|uniref:hypothetical protein n=1 Tax=Clostridium sp. VAP23 TaxID=2949981 RepID=UPI002079D532|nr:hypothetical protein [Clostridium sp. VAP23]
MVSNTLFICQLSKEKQNLIKKLTIEYLVNEGYEINKIDEIVENVMNNRLWIIENFIDLKQVF